jgi:hypothetical protein
LDLLIALSTFKCRDLPKCGTNSNDLNRCAVSNIFGGITNTHSLKAKDSMMKLLSQEEGDMRHSHRYFFSSFFLTAALAAPTAMSAATGLQDKERQEEHRRDDNDRNRIYDRAHKDYHNWDDSEDRSYRLYLGERHREYQPFTEVKEKEQRAYWNWRHSHPDHDHERR